jgi:molybdopterin synthase sulfur carrier subunit
MTAVTFEFFANVARLAGTTQMAVEAGDAVTVGDAIAALNALHPDLAGAVDACACVSGDAVVRRRDPLPADRRIALLPPVAGG